MKTKMRDEKVLISDLESPGVIRGFFERYGKYLAIFTGFLVCAAAFNQKETWKPNSVDTFQRLGEMTFSERVVTFQNTKTKFIKIKPDIYKSNHKTSEFCGFDSDVYMRWKKDGKYLDIRLYDDSATENSNRYCVQYSYVR